MQLKIINLSILQLYCRVYLFFIFYLNGLKDIAFGSPIYIDYLLGYRLFINIMQEPQGGEQKEKKSEKMLRENEAIARTGGGTRSFEGVGQGSKKFHVMSWAEACC